MVFFDMGFNSDQPLENEYDIAIIGGGPAGLAAGIYASRGGLKTVIFEKGNEGGQMLLTQDIENYPGFLSIKGRDLANKLLEHSSHFGVKLSNKEVTKVDLSDKNKTIILENGQQIKAKTIVISTGAQYRKLNIPGESRFTGRGVSYCAICDGAFFRNKKVAVAGGGNSAVDEALYLTQMASEVMIIHRRNELRADKILQKRAFENKKMVFEWDSVIKEIKGDKFVNSIAVENVKTKEIKEISIDGVFIYIGLLPKTDLFKDQLNLADGGFLKVDPVTLETNIKGVFGAGDVIEKELRQIITAAAEGALSATMAIRKYFN